LVRAPIKKARAGFPVAPVVFIFYFQTNKWEGVNPPTFEVYISILISGLGRIEWFYPLDKILGEAGFQFFTTVFSVAGAFVSRAGDFFFGTVICSLGLNVGWYGASTSIRASWSMRFLRE